MKTVKILGETIAPGETKILDMEIARLHTSTKLKVPVIVTRAKIDGPTVLFSAGIHGDEINGVEIVRQIIYKKINRPKRGVIICIPIINMFGYVNQSRQFNRAPQMFVAHKSTNDVAFLTQLVCYVAYQRKAGLI